MDTLLWREPARGQITSKASGGNQVRNPVVTRSESGRLPPKTNVCMQSKAQAKQTAAAEMYSHTVGRQTPFPSPFHLISSCGFGTCEHSQGHRRTVRHLISSSLSSLYRFPPGSQFPPGFHLPPDSHPESLGATSGTCNMFDTSRVFFVMNCVLLVSPNLSNSDDRL